MYAHRIMTCVMKMVAARVAEGFMCARKHLNRPSTVPRFVVLDKECGQNVDRPGGPWTTTVPPRRVFPRTYRGKVVQ